MKGLQKKRFHWITLYKQLNNAGMVCLKCGISRPILSKWLKRYEENGLAGLLEKNRTPFNFPKKKVFGQ
jgi:transposase-like protein